MTGKVVDISAAGNRVAVPALEVDGRTVIVMGKWLKVAAIHDQEWVSDDVQDIESYIQRLKEQKSHGFRADVFTVTQQLPDITPRYSYPIEWESIAAIPTDDYDEWWTRRISRDARTDVRKAAKRGVILKVAKFDDDFVRGIIELYNETPVRQGKPFWHYQKDFDTVKRENATYLDRSVFIGAYFEDQLIGFIKFVQVGSVAAMMQILSKTSHKDKRPSNALIAKAVEQCAATGASFLTYGKYRHLNKGTSSLTRFKHRMGFEEIRVPKFYVPLTTKGRISLALGLHRDLVLLVPEGLIDVLYRLRTKWNRGRMLASADTAQSAS